MKFLKPGYFILLSRRIDIRYVELCSILEMAVEFEGYLQ